MRYLKLLIIPCLLSTVLCVAQTTGKSLLYKLFQNFPLDSSQTFIAQYCQKNNCWTQANIYDSSKTDFSKKIKDYSPVKFQPTTTLLNYYYAYKYALGDTIPNETLITSLTLSYQDTITNNANKEYKELIKRFKKIYTHSDKAYLVSEHGREGEWFKFYIGKSDKLPILSIELRYSRKGFLGTASSIIINYIRPYPRTEGNKRTTVVFIKSWRDVKHST